jgi:alpha-glucosidase
VIADSLAAFPAGSCPVWAGSNHDLPRLANRWGGGDPRRLRLAQTILALLPGAFVLYYGDELGMVDSDIAADQQRDPLTAGGLNGQWPRDNARAPMRWTSAPAGDFSTGRPWLPIHPDPSDNVESQQRDPQSTLVLTRALIQLHAEHLSHSEAAYREVEVSGSRWRFDSGRLSIAANFSDQPITVDQPGPVLLSSRTVEAVRPESRDGLVDLAPWEAVVLLRPAL